MTHRLRFASKFIALSTAAVTLALFVFTFPEFWPGRIIAYHYWWAKCGSQPYLGVTLSFAVGQSRYLTAPGIDPAKVFLPDGIPLSYKYYCTEIEAQDDGFFYRESE